MKGLALRRALRVLGLLLVIGVAFYVWEMLGAASEVRQLVGDGVVERKLGFMTILTVERVGQTSTLKPGAGLLLVLVIPAMAAFLTYLATVSRPARPRTR
jgi:hypothetical protein